MLAQPLPRACDITSNQYPLFLPLSTAPQLEDEFAGTENLRDFIRAAVDYAVEIGVWPGTYLVHMEILNVFMVLFSTQVGWLAVLAGWLC